MAGLSALAMLVANLGLQQPLRAAEPTVPPSDRSAERSPTTPPVPTDARAIPSAPARPSRLTMDGYRFLTVEINQGTTTNRVGWEWTLWRSDQQVRIVRTPNLWDRARGLGASEEIWSLDPRGRLTHRRVFHRERRIIDFQAADVQMLGLDEEWTTVRSLIHPEWLVRHLAPMGQTNGAAGAATVFRAMRGAARYEVHWMEARKLPAYIRQETPTATVEITLKGVVPPGEQPPPVEEVAVDYIQTDYADLGDLQRDVAVRQLLHNYKIPHVTCQ